MGRTKYLLINGKINVIYEILVDGSYYDYSLGGDLTQ
jgi:hypothetical protein